MADSEKAAGIDTQVQLARISAIQAITVAVIAAIGGIFAGYYGHQRISEVSLQQPKQWLTVDRVESRTFTTCRIVLSVNGYNYSYPSTAVWARVGASPRERFALPSDSTYRITFRALVPEGRDAQLFESPEVQQVPSGVTLHQMYTLYPGVAVRGPADSDRAINLFYSIQ